MRRRILGLAAIAVALAAAAATGAAALVWTSAPTSNVGELRFENRLRIPPLLTPAGGSHGGRIELRLRTGRSQFVPGRTTETWGVNGAYLGPTLRVERGDHVNLEVENDLPEATTVHWHGLEVPGEDDGGPHNLIRPGDTWTPSWHVDQPAATLWYHPHPHGRTADHVYRGVAGMLIVEDEESRRLALPHDYGVDDIPLIVQDTRLDDDGRLDFSQGAISPTGRLGDEILVNGTRSPHVRVSRSRVRLRVLNASGARIYNFGFADGRAFELIATDGGFVERPRRMRRIQLSPGERAELVVRFHPGERVVLRSFEPELGDTDFFNERFAGGDDTFDVLEFRAARRLGPSAAVPESLAEAELPDPDDAVRTRRFELTSGRSINSRSFDMGRVDAIAGHGDTELWEVENETGIPHNFHVHGVRFRVVSHSSGAVPAPLEGPQDTIALMPGESARLAVRFRKRATRAAPYMFHCHLLDHEDRGMMGQLAVLPRGASLGDAPEHEHGDEHE